ncbi:MAG TPA: efflux RND transporter periplasmic adaptor subunit [Acidiferrobacteraceae bacterium]|nr:efflux RND transporter periplasmic adaptor subunit [Acidiferrobacteraceae bacterium]
MKKSYWYTLLGFALVFGPVFLWKWHAHVTKQEAMSKHANAGATVLAARAQMRPWTRTLSSVGTLTAVNGIEIAPQLAGTVTAVHFHSGQMVRQGQQLVEINNALVLRAPFTGHLGIRHVSLGQYVSPGTSLVSLQTWNPVYVDFSLPQNALSRVALGQTVHLRVDAFAHHTFTGHVTAIGSKVDAATRAVSVRALIRNPQMQLRPGMFGTVVLLAGHSRPVLAVPDTAIAYSSFGDYVYTIQPPGGTVHVPHVRRVPVTVGATHDGFVEILKGLKVGDDVVIAGQIKLRNHMPVTVAHPAGDRAP